MDSPAQWMRFRLGFLYLCFVIFLLLVLGRLAQLQVFPNQQLEALKKKQFQKTKRQKAHRRPIYDRNGEALAVTMKAASIFAHPRRVKNKRATARALKSVLGGTIRKWERRLKRDRPFVWIRRQVSESIATKIRSKKLAGIHAAPANKRIYLHGELASNVLGFTGVDGNGLAGLEHYLDKQLFRRSTQFTLPRDGHGKTSYIGKRYLSGQKTNSGVYVTIDRTLQYLLENEIESAKLNWGAKAVMGIILDPFSGEILAMAQRPTFDPNNAKHFSPRLFTNRVISHRFEPGSTLKVVLAAEAIERSILHENSPIYCEKGSYQVEKKVIREANNQSFGTLPLNQVLRYSSNIGAAKIAEKLGLDRVQSALTRFGLTKKTGVLLPAETRGTNKVGKDWGPVVLANVGFGQGISVSPLQMAVAFGAIANGGYLVRPKIVLSEVNPQSEQSQGKLNIRRILSPKTAASMKEMLIGVVESEDGTGKAARVPGIVVAGKTGTAQKYTAEEGYQSGKYFSSFIGFLPADQPQLLIAVMVDEPETEYYSSQTVAPLFSRIAQKAIHLVGRSRVPPQEKFVQPRKHKITSPSPKLKLTKDHKGRYLMPNLKGYGVRQVLATFGNHFKNIRVVGSGYLVHQVPAPGHPVYKNTRITLKFSSLG